MSGPSAVILAGPSGVGKGTLINKLRQEFPKLFGFSVSHTTRQPRPNEVHGVHYNFVTVPQMQNDIRNDAFIEYAQVHDRYYGTSFKAVDTVRNFGRICVLDIDVQGCRKIRERKGFKGKFVFVAPPSMEELERRLRGRATEDEESLKKRLENARGEMEARDEEGLFDYVVVNDNLEKAYAELKDILKDDIAEAKSQLSKVTEEEKKE